MLLGLLDYGARMYDPAIGRWTAQDPLSEKYYSYSAYNYCVNNPVMFVDPDGKKIVIGTVWEESFPSWAKPAYFKKYQNEVQSHLTELKQYKNAYIFEKNEEISIFLENIIRQIYNEKRR